MIRHALNSGNHPTLHSTSSTKNIATTHSDLCHHHHHHGSSSAIATSHVSANNGGDHNLPLGSISSRKPSLVRFNITSNPMEEQQQQEPDETEKLSSTVTVSFSDDQNYNYYNSGGGGRSNNKDPDNFGGKEIRFCHSSPCFPSYLEPPDASLSPLSFPAHHSSWSNEQGGPCTTAGSKPECRRCSSPEDRNLSKTSPSTLMKRDFR